MSSTRSPFLKWAGGKRHLVPFIAKTLGLLPGDAEGPGLRRWTRLIEPFAGSAALSLALADAFESLWLNDVNADVINVYAALRDAPEEFIGVARELFHPGLNDAAAYYRLRDEFNRCRCPQRRAALFLYLNRHGYNGLCRYNRAGEFNVPFGRYKRPYFPEVELKAAVDVVRKARLTSIDFEDVLRCAGPGDVVYCDPPYVPLSPTASFTDYASRGFGPAEQERLAAAAADAARRGALVAVSNHDTEWTRALYRDADVYHVQVRRTISCNGRSRGVVGEILAVYWPDPRAAGGRRQGGERAAAAARTSCA